MHPAYELPHFTSSRSTPSTLDADLVAIPIYESGGGVTDALDEATGGELRAAIARGEFRGKLGEIWTTPVSGWRSRRVTFVGAGRAPIDSERARRVGACVVMTARQQRRARVAIATTDPWPDAALESLVEGAAAGNFDGGPYKTKADNRFFVAAVEIASVEQDASAAVERGTRVGEVVNLARTLVNEPGNRLPPRELVSRGQAMLTLPDVTTEVLDEAKLDELGMGMLLGVGRGSAEGPRLLVARYEPPAAPAAPVLGLVGKGVTFDTGGLSIKPADGMERMKDDMAGGAAVIAALRAVALERVPLRVIAVVPATENMPSGTATRPGDVIRSASGLTVEVNNTDAEGRLILADALWYARQAGATHLIDVATLTGACVVALGKITTGLFATDGWGDVLRDAAERAGEKVWPLPLFDEYREALDSDIADMRNSPGRPAGAITAAMFLKAFAGELPWAHLDIAGTAWAEDAKPWAGKGATGVMIRTLIEVARTAGRNWPAKG